MLYIEKNQKIPLPKKFHEANNVSAIIYDQLTEIIKEDLYHPLNTTSFDLTGDDIKLKDELIKGSVHAFDFLKENQMTVELETALVKHVTMSILGDFINFVYESLSCAQRGKMEVAYSLLRKPFIDELLIFEQILIDRSDFIHRFFHVGEPKKYDPSSRDILREDIVQKSFDIIKNKTTMFFTSDIIYTLRYDKSSPTGINGLSNRALHIVTTDKNYVTENQELNFVFSTPEDYMQYWDHYYYFVPILLIYAVSVVDEILFTYIPGEIAQAHKTVKALIRMIGFLILHEKNHKSRRNTLKDIYKALGDILQFKCESCQKINIIEKEDFKLFFEIENFLCTSCGDGLLGSDNSMEVLKKFVKSNE